jgi:hypothetical protein
MSRSTPIFESWVSVDDIIRLRLGKLWKFKISEIDAWVKAGGPGMAKAADPSLPRGGADESIGQ